EPIRIAKSAVRRALRRMEARDTFQIIRFSNNASAMGPAPIPATPRNVERGLKYLDSLEGSGGTMMIEGIKAALDFAHDPQRVRVVSFLTDGFIGNDAEILGEVHKRLGASRIFSFGIGSSTNRYLLTRMAQIGRGAVAFVGIDESAAQAVDGFYECVSHAAMTDIDIDFGGLDVTDVYPRRIPDLFVGRPVVLTGRFKGAGNATIRVAGTAGDGRQDITLHANTDDAAATHKGLPSVWARMRIADLADQATYDTNTDLPGEIKEVALEYGLMSAFTAFVAVDSQSKTAGDHGTTVSVAVPVPEGVRYETTVSD
ncbi:MAG: hypothetical protein JXA69_03190, partial [Phycisphaerae bacterium]|nr:hypothetical protein [Phycisphaerae bacterium]